MQHIKPLPLLFAFTLLTLTIFSSCDVSNSSDSTGTLNIRLTDAPASYEAVYIDIQRVELNMADEGGEEDWETISTHSARVDLLKLDNGADSLLAGIELEAQTYHQLRLVFGPNNEVLVNGESHTLAVSGEQESGGFVIDINATVREDMEATKIIDLDAARSVSVTGNGEYKLNPVMRVFDPTETGSLSGQLVPPRVPVLISARIGNETITTTYAEDDGSFKLVGLEDNVYKLLIQPATGQYADTTLFEQPVTAGQDHNVGIIQLEE